ncbi:hypothetical protein MCOR27_000508 [Pyricularia oryzae]|uniref:Major facilitator superfamily (MFS) profile domain-containing protein n=1 Tax=Pyricularia grisea TaxID=148305 RepID=A0ABQ8NYU4_PYRGI|nr:hypothetical protein MCOR01_010250 [Pyricularia oryzae]KAI6304110.1 hypothetical protein MCOR33_000856 [Pyricularia grisea]KAI6262211.1 hypothetical protein MCOR19_001562 [Pyricularia oryzae]KAI6279875.1 hypothetical protein MCOR26_004004 [Pyricularia oryzae]KAI6288940.1 hypothetical protein MCOR27_000508 [Pyricularia oryzae]
MAPPKPQPTLRGAANVPRHFNGALTYAVVLIAVSQINFGLDQGIFSNTQAMPHFYRQFGAPDPKTGKYALDPVFLSLLNSLPFICFFLGLVQGSYISNKWGRRTSMHVMCVWALISAAVCVSARGRVQVVAGRMINYIYIGMELAVVPIIQSEMVPAPVRGFIVGTYQLGLGLGHILASLICRATSDIDSNNSWIIPYGCMFLIPSIILCMLWHMPESPRWLLLQGRDDAALASLRRLRVGRFTEEQIRDELASFRSTINVAADKGTWKEVFQGSNRKRTLIVCGVNVFFQLTGHNFVSKYGTIFLRSLNTFNAFSMSLINSCINTLVIIFTMFLSDMVGRVPLLITGASIQTAALLTMGGLGTAGGERAPLPIREGITSMVTLFGVGFNLGWAPLSHVVAAEIPTLRLRDKIYGLGSAINIIIQFLVAFIVPYLMDDAYAGLGPRVGFIFGTVAFVAVVFSWFCVPECSGRTLEEIDRLFLEGVPIRSFKTHVLADQEEDKGLQRNSESWPHKREDAKELAGLMLEQSRAG